MRTFTTARPALAAVMLTVLAETAASAADPSYQVRVRTHSEHPSCNFANDGSVDIENSDANYSYRIHFTLYATNGCSSSCSGAGCDWTDENCDSCSGNESCSTREHCKGCKTTCEYQGSIHACEATGEGSIEVGPSQSSYHQGVALQMPPCDSNQDCDEPYGIACTDVWFTSAAITHTKAASPGAVWVAVSTPVMLCKRENTGYNDCWGHNAGGCTDDVCDAGPWCVRNTTGVCLPLER